MLDFQVDKSLGHFDLDDTWFLTQYFGLMFPALLSTKSSPVYFCHNYLNKGEIFFFVVVVLCFFGLRSNFTNL